jgi:Immunity protein 42
MIFGKKEEFAIECLVKDIKDKIVFGELFIWVGNERLGSEIDVILNTPIEFFRESISFSGQRQNDELANMTNSEVMDFLDEALWGNNGSDLDFLSLEDILQQEKKYAKYNICTNFSESFDGESLYLIETDNGEKFVWKQFGSETIKSIEVGHKVYKSIIETFLDWYYKLFEKVDSFHLQSSVTN